MDHWLSNDDAMAQSAIGWIGFRAHWDEEREPIPCVGEAESETNGNPTNANKIALVTSTMYHLPN